MPRKNLVVRLVFCFGLVLALAFLSLNWWRTSVSIAQDAPSSIVPVYTTRMYVSYQYNLLKNPTGLLILNLKNGGMNLFIADSGNHVIRRFRPAVGSTPGSLTTVAGISGTAGYANGTPSAAKFNYPTGLSGTNSFYRLCQNLDNSLGTTGGGQDSTTSSDSGGTDASSAGVNSEEEGDQPISPPGYVCAYYDYQTIYVNDSQNYVIRKLRIGALPEPEQPSVTTVGGTAQASGFANGPVTSSSFGALGGLSNNGSTYYVADVGNNSIRTWNGTSVSTFAGDGTPGFVDGYRTGARFMAPGKATMDTAGNIHVADIGNNAIQED